MRNKYQKKKLFQFFAWTWVFVLVGFIASLSIASLIPSVNVMFGCGVPIDIILLGCFASVARVYLPKTWRIVFPPKQRYTNKYYE